MKMSDLSDVTQKWIWVFLEMTNKTLNYKLACGSYQVPTKKLYLLKLLLGIL